MHEVLQAALRGGVAHVTCLPDSNPVLDEPRLVTQLIHQAESLNLATIHPLGALTQGLKGEQLAEMATLVENGCVALASRPADTQYASITTCLGIRGQFQFTRLVACAGQFFIGRLCGSGRIRLAIGLIRRACCG